MAKSTIHTKELDSRFTGYSYFKYQVTLINLPTDQRMTASRGAYADLLRIIDFNKIRDWCWDTWGASCDLKDYDRILELKGYPSVSSYSDRMEIIEDYGLNTKWCFANESIAMADGRQRDRRIYLRGDEELAWLELRWK
mgnify:CR=1 FL=1